MEIVPLVGQQVVTAGTISVAVNPKDRDRAEALVLRTSTILRVTDNETFLMAKRYAGELKALVTEIDDSRKAAKRPFSAVEKAIDGVALEVGQPVTDEQRRILGLLNGYVAELEAKAKEEARAKAAALEQEVAAKREEQRRVMLAQFQAEIDARNATDEMDRADKAAEAKRRAEVAEAAQIAAEMAGEIAKIGEQPKKSFVPGGRVDHTWEFKLLDVQATVRAGSWRLLRWELDKRACQDSCKAQLELNPDTAPTLPGIEVSSSINVSVRASAKIT